MRALRADRILAVGLMWGLALLEVQAGGAQPPAKTDPDEEPKKLNELIEKSIDWYDVFPEKDAAALKPVPIARWRNVIRGQEGEAMLVVWSHNGRPVAMASIYPWQGKMNHEFDSLS